MSDVNPPQKQTIKSTSYLMQDDSCSKEKLDQRAISDSNTKCHINFVISDPDPDNNVLVVNATKVYSSNGRKRLGYDESCLLFKGDHSFIKEDSFIIYKLAKEANEYSLGYREAHAFILRKEKISKELLERIQEGAKKSSFLNDKFRKYFEFF